MTTENTPRTILKAYPSAEPALRQEVVDLTEYRSHMARILGEKELQLADAAMIIARLSRRIQELEARNNGSQ